MNKVFYIFVIDNRIMINFSRYYYTRYDMVILECFGIVTDR